MRVVFENEQVVARGGVQQRAAARHRHEHASRVLEVRRDVDEARPLPRRRQPRHRVVESVDGHPVVVLRNPDELRLKIVERRDRAAVGRKLHEHDVAGIDQRASGQVEALLRSGRDDDLVDRGRHPARRELRNDLIDQRPIATRRTVLQGVRIVPFEQLRADRAQLFPREHLRCGIPGGKRDQVGHAGGQRAGLADRRFLVVPRRRRRNV